MPLTTDSLLALTAGDLMTRQLVCLPEVMPLREAARLLLRSQVSGAPVVDGQGKCVGVLSATDFLRLSARRADATHSTPPELPLTCPFQAIQRRPDGKEVVTCRLPPGVCPLQVKSGGQDGDQVLCCEPHCVLVDWQMVDIERLPMDQVRRFMTPNPVTARPDTPIRALARRMIDGHLHRLIVVDEGARPTGVVSSTDLLAALAYAEATAGG
jgi:CBS domain-containing protein